MTNRLRLTLFGAPCVDDAGVRSALAFERRSQLLVWLALKRGWAARTELAALLWPEIDGRLAHANLRKTLFRLQALPWGRAIDSAGGALRLDADTDVAAFESALQAQRRDQALALREGELLTGFDDPGNERWTSWLQFERERLRVAWRGAALARLDEAMAAAEGVALAARLLDDDPLDEAALRAHMRWLAADGQAAAARQAYRQFSRRIADELGVAPGAELRATHDALPSPGSAGPAGAQDSGGSAAAAPAPWRSAPDPRFVGRAAELRQIATLLAQDDCRVLSLVGPGGVGKTALARRAMNELEPRFDDGAHFVELEDVASPVDAAARLARAIGRPVGAEPLADALAWMGERQLLLVLDNLEQLPAAAAMLEQMLQSCPRLKLVVTSRDRLGTAGERLLPVAGLPCPDPEDADHVEAFDAVRLFVAAAQRVDPSFDPAPHARALITICRQVEGLPLALELAAAWVRVLPCAAIADELAQGGELLRAVDSARPPRHASVAVVFEQSWHRLGALEREVLARLSVFRGGFSAEAARAVANASLPVLAALTDKSLLRKEGDRSQLHALVQQLAGERFADAQARADAEAAHGAYFLRLLAQLRARVDDGDREALQQVDTEFENCRRAWCWAVAEARVDALAAGAATLMHFCDHRGRLGQGLEMLRHALAAPAADATPRLRALLLAMAAHLAYRLDRFAEAEADASAALAASRAGGDHEARLQGLKVLGACSLGRGRLADAARYFARVLRLAPAGADPRNAAAMLDNLARVERAAGRYDEARRLSLQSLAAFRRIGDVAGEALCLNNLGAGYLDGGDPDAAALHLRDALALCDRHGLAGTRAIVLTNLTELAVKTGDDAAVQRHGTRALEVAAEVGNRRLDAWVRQQLARSAMRRGDLDMARTQLSAAMSLALAIGRPSLQLAGVACFAQLLAAMDRVDCAASVLRFAAGHPAIAAPERDAALAQLAAWRADGAASAAGVTGVAGVADVERWPGLSLDELAHRIVAEAGVAHAPLVAALRGA
jgi:predicted ATPase/DNA-binding SARP family transcriptional activator